MTTIDSSTTPQRVLHARVMGVEFAEGIRAILREPTALFFSVLMPVMLFALFISLFGNQPSPDGITYGARMLATFGTFGVVSVMLMNPGIGVANDRASGWLRVKKVSAAPIGATIAGKVLAALPYALFAILAYTALSLVISGVSMDLGTWLRLVAVLILGSLPFALLGLAVGFVTSANAAAAVLNAIFFPLSIASGLWMPLEMMPAFIQNIAPYLPTYHLARLAVAQLDGGPALGHLLALLLTTVVAAGLAGWAYRNLRV
ncbi:ABC transporter permease [Pseudonocardia sp. GCM10023141]|uniref:ABC transporter permease n=1 Tax=Pseudonocardia sp. GCM10023141 TaxID=3252653 RepID=UPI00361892AB